tara:strand:+ start:87 stop:278 length:192 start_codon:yes stop_codon:yes gene_type:complete
MAKTKSKKQQLQDLKQKEHDKRYIKTAKAKKKDPEAPYSDNPTPGHPGWNLSRKGKGPNSVNV